MPGAIVTKQEGTFYTTKDIDLSKQPLTFVANRDENGQAKLKLYLDDGESLNQQTEYYEFLLSANSLKKWNVEVNQESKRGKLDKLVITNAKDLNDTNFACMTADSDWAQTSLDFTYDEDKMTLSIF
jgi:hypothetical protein